MHEEFAMRKRVKNIKSVGHGPPFVNAYDFVPLWITPRMRFGFLFFGFSVAAGLWAIVRSNNS